MKNIRNIPVQSKLIGIIFLVAFLGIAPVFAFIIYSDINMFRTDLESNTIMNAKLIGEYCVTPLVFEDKSSGKDVLKRLKTIPYIADGYLYDNRGVLFSVYNRSERTTIPSMPFKEGLQFTDDYLHVIDPIVYEGSEYGTIYLLVSTSLLNSKINKYLLTMLSLMAMLIFLIYFLARGFQKILSGPILKLVDVTKRISESGEYSIRIEKTGTDEIGILCDSFNEMLSRIQRREEERNRAEQELRRSEQKFRSLIETTSDWVWEVDKNGIYTYSSPKVEDLLGYKPDEVIGKRPTDFMSQDESDRISGLFRDIVASETPFSRMETFNFHKDEKQVVIETSGVPILDENGELLGYRGIDRDITERKKEEEKRRKLEATLQRSEKMEAIGSLAGRAAHDLNNVLSGIVGYPDLLLMQLPEESPLRRPILAMQKSGEKAAAIVQDLLTMTRRGVVTTEIVGINDIISSYLQSPEHEKLLSYNPETGIKTALETDLLNISGSFHHISKCVMNLVSNAAEAMPKGGSISISTENRYIDRPVSGYESVDEGDYVILTISDTGTGIHPDDLDKIFEPFYSKKVMGKSGTGLGMVVVWGTVKDHNGYIDVNSNVGKGTRFTLYFPATRQEKTKNEKSLDIEDYMGKGESILIVDDVSGQRKIASTMLTRLGYTVSTVSSGEEALEYLKKHSADLIVLDMIMEPGMDGLDTYRKIIKLHPEQKAIIASGFSETERVKEAQSLGAGQYVKKPYTLQNIGVAAGKELRGQETKQGSGNKTGVRGQGATSNNHPVTSSFFVLL